MSILDDWKTQKIIALILSISDTDFVDIAFKGLTYSIRDKLEEHDFFWVAQVQIVQESQIECDKESSKPYRSNAHIDDYDSENERWR